MTSYTMSLLKRHRKSKNLNRAQVFNSKHLYLGVFLITCNRCPNVSQINTKTARLPPPSPLFPHFLCLRPICTSTRATTVARMSKTLSPIPTFYANTDCRQDLNPGTRTGTKLFWPYMLKLSCENS